MARIRYTDEQKAEALVKIASQGAAKTAEELGININTLYKWRNAEKQLEAENAGAPTNEDKKKAIKKAKALISKVDNTMEAKLERLTAENKRLSAANAELQAENSRISAELLKLKEAIQAFIS